MLKENISLLKGLQQTKELVSRRNIRVKSSKLPSDFFIDLKSNRYSAKKYSQPHSITDEQTRQTYTPSFSRQQNLSIHINSPVLTNHRKIETARLMMNTDDSLINDVISTTRKIKRVFRKKSVQLGNRSFKIQEIELQLPKIRNLRHQSNLF